MKPRGPKLSIEQLDQHLAKKEYGKALDLIEHELKRRPDQLNLRLRKADILDMQGHRERALEVYRKVADSQARDGFYARAIAIYKKILRLDPDHEVAADLARLIEEDHSNRYPAQTVVGQTAESPSAADDQEVKELKASILFASFDVEALQEIITSTELRSFAEGDIIVTEGEHGTSLFLIVSGSVKVFTRTDEGGHLPLAELGPGDFFGEVSLLTGKPRTATITARTEVTAIELDRASVDRIAEHHPEVQRVLEDFYNRRAHETVEAVIRRMRTLG